MKILDLKDSHRYNLQFDVDGQFVKRTDNNLPVAKCKNLFKAKFNFIGDEWTGTKTALFAQGECSKSAVLDDKDECVIPWEFFDTDENMTIGKVSVSCGDLVTTNCATVKITKSGYQESDTSVPPSPDVYQQLVELAEDTKEIAQSVREDADAGEFDGEEGYSPKVSLTEELDGVTVTVQNKDGQQSAKVKNGKDGKNYEHSEEFTRLAEQVRQDKESVEQTKTAVDKTAQDFTLTAQQALADVNNAGQTQSERVQQVGQDAIADVNTAKTQAVETVNATKTDAVKAVQTEGTKQTEAVQVKGQEVINSIPSDFTTQMATKLDKQQGTENAGKSLIIGEDGTVIVGEPAVQIEVDKTLAQEGQAADAKATGDKILQYAIKNTASGEGIVKITDSAEEKLQDIKLFGKSEQLSTTGKNLFDFSNLESGRINTNTGALEEYNHTRRLADYIDITDITSFSVYLPGYNRANGTVYVVIHYYDKDKKYLSYRACGDKLEKYENITPVENAVYIKVTFEQVSIDNPQNIFKVQLEKGTKSTDYEPYTGTKPSPSTAYPQEITSAGKLNDDTGKYEVNVQISSGNIFDVDAVRNENGYLNSDSQTALNTNRFDIVEGRQYLLISKGSMLTDGTGYSSPYFGEDNLNYGNNHLDILGKEPGYQMFTKNERRKVILKAKKSTTITKFIVHGYNKAKDAYEVEEMGLFETSNNNTNIDYVPYKGLQKVQFQLDRPFTKWDRIEKRDGMYGIVYKHRIVEDFATLVKDSEPIYGNTGEKYFSVVLKDATLNYNYDKVYSEVGLYKKDVQKLYVPKVMLSSFIVGVNDTDTIETAKEHMHYKVIYETDSEEFVPLPEETQTVLNALHTYYPTTVMSNSEDCEMEVEYVADTKNYIDNKISANVASIISQYQTNVVNLLSLMPLSVQAGMVENDTNNILENVEVTK